jgi:hypothetical protein
MLKDPLLFTRHRFVASCLNILLRPILPVLILPGLEQRDACG